MTTTIMPRFLSAAIAVFALCCPTGAFSQSGEEIVDRYFFEKDPPHGALIFQQRRDLEGTALGLATGSPYTHVGIIRITGGGPYVMQSSEETGGVEEIPLDEFVSAGVDRKFAIYVTEDDYRPGGQTNSPASLAAYDYYHLPYDPFYRQDSGAIYNAELIFDVFTKIGHPLGRLQRIGDLNFDTEAGRGFLMRRWRERPECRSGDVSEEACWNRIKEEPIVTPESIAGDRRLRLYMTTF